MRLSKLIIVKLLILGLILSFFTISISSEETIDNIVNARFDIEFETATDLRVTVTMDVSKITLEGSDKTYTGEQIKNISTSDLIKLGAIEQQLNIYLGEQISETFPNSNICQGSLGCLGNSKTPGAIFSTTETITCRLPVSDVISTKSPSATPRPRASRR